MKKKLSSLIRGTGAAQKAVQKTVQNTVKKITQRAPASTIIKNATSKTLGSGFRPSVSKIDSLTKRQIKELNERLIVLRAEIFEKVNGKAGTFQVGLDAESLIKGDDAEVAEKQRASNAALQELDFLKGRLALVERALAKIAAGVYGLCEETDEPIGYERLSAVPWARFSVHVQEVRERRMREFKVSRLRSEA